MSGGRGFTIMQDPYKTWHKMYSFNPYQGLKTHQRNLVLGGQVALWTPQRHSQDCKTSGLVKFLDD
ncbi:hypothetical protein FS837_004630 [Tulasnella sp. UAMH 9824]|nr:hypothetical protein FS837_004630 [Tulasnella sp. UAMH 9824]